MANKMDHTNCTHPRTPAGRRACRAQVAAGGPAPVAVDYIAEHIRKTAANGAMKARMDREYAERTTITISHCSGCGSTDVHDSTDGYTMCCNEPLVWNCGSRCTH